MKQTITLLALVAGFATSNAQVAFPLDNAVWKQRIGNGEAAPTYALVGTKTTDVVLDGITYRKVYLSSDDAIFAESEYIGGLRETSGGKVYYRASTATTEKLIYDFSVVVGDTILDATTGGKSGIVVSVDYVTIGGIARKQIKFRHQNSTAEWTGGSWIEGIGNSNLGGLLGSPMLQATCDCGAKTVCLTVDGVSVFSNPAFATVGCDMPAGIGYDIRKTVNVSVTPNPTRSNTTFGWATGSEFDLLNIYDMSGRSVNQMTVSNKNMVVVDLSVLSPGTYFYQLTGKTDPQTGKFSVN